MKTLEGSIIKIAATEIATIGAAVVSGLELTNHSLETGFITPQYLEASALTYIAGSYTIIEMSRRKILEIIQSQSQ